MDMSLTGLDNGIVSVICTIADKLEDNLNLRFNVVNENEEEVIGFTMSATATVKNANRGVQPTISIAELMRTLYGCNYRYVCESDEFVVTFK